MKLMQPEMFNSMLADVEEVIEVIETVLDRRSQPGSPRALASAQKSTPRAGNDVGQQTDVGCGQPRLLQQGMQGGQRLALDIRQHQVLMVGDPDLAKAEGLGRICHHAASAPTWHRPVPCHAP